MPILPTYTAQAQPLGIGGGRRAGADDFVGGAGLENFGKGVSRAVDTYVADAEDNETRKALVATTQIREKYAKALDEAALSGADLGGLKEQMANELAKVGESFQTKRGQDSLALYTANSNLIYDQQANTIQVRRAYSTAKLEGGKFLNSASAIIQSNPAYLEEAENNAEAFGATLRGVRPDQREEIVKGLKQELNMAAALGASRIDPAGTKAKLDAGEWDLTPGQRNTAINKADTEIRARRAEDAYNQGLANKARLDASEESRDKWFKGIIGGTTKRRDIMDDPSLLPAAREHLIVFMEQRAKALAGEEKRSDPRVVRDLWLSINAPDGDPRKIFNGDAIFAAVSSGKVSTSDANLLNNLVANQKDENGRNIGQKLGGLMSVVGRALSQDPQFVAQPALVAEIQMDYQARVFDRAAEMRDKKQNPNDIFNPSSKDYVGSREFIQGSIDAAREKQRRIQPMLEKGGTVVRDGKTWEFLGGDRANSKNWRELADKPGTGRW